MIEIPEGAKVEAKFELPPDRQSQCDAFSELIAQRIDEIFKHFVWDLMSEDQRYKGVQRAKEHIAQDPYIKRWQKDISLIHQIYGQRVIWREVAGEK